MEKKIYSQPTSTEPSAEGKVTSISENLIIAEFSTLPQLYEVVLIGNDQLMAEVVEIKDKSQCYLQCFDFSTQVNSGDIIKGTGQKLQVELGPGLLGQAFDGVLRPLGSIENFEEQNFIKKGINSNCSLDRKDVWKFTPNNDLVIGESQVSGGAILGAVQGLQTNQSTMNMNIPFPPFAPKGKLIFLAKEDKYNIDEKIAEIEAEDGTKHSYTMTYYWPIRQAHPNNGLVTPTRPFHLGIRVTDLLFPVALGGVAQVHQTSGSTSLTDQVLKSEADVVVFISNNPRDDINKDSLDDFNKDEQQYWNGKEMSKLKQRTVYLSHNSKLPSGLLNASFYTALTVAEYYRNQGLNVAFGFDGTPAWTENLQKASSQFHSSDNSAKFISEQIESLYKRAGQIECLGEPKRQGSITMLTTLHAEGIENPEHPLVAPHTKFASASWRLNKTLAQRKHFPNVEWEKSSSKDLQLLEPYFLKLDGQYYQMREALLQQCTEYMNYIALKDKSEAPEQQICYNQIGKSMTEDFLMQNVWTEYDCFSPELKGLVSLQSFYHVLIQLRGCFTGSSSSSSGEVSSSQINKIKDTVQNYFMGVYGIKFEKPSQDAQKFIDYREQLKKGITSALEQYQVKSQDD